MINIMDKMSIINLKMKGQSNREISRTLGINRKTIAKIWNEYLSLQDQLSNTDDQDEIRDIQQRIACASTYNSKNRKKVKVNNQILADIDELLDFEVRKENDLGINHKQKITNSLIHKTLLKKGHDIGLTTVTNIVREKREKIKETFIRQTYKFGQRLEFDFGEVKLLINGIINKYYLAVLSSPASNYRVAYLYKSQDKKVFMDAHVRFFESVGGVYNEVVYDNMRNVVSKFIGKNEKDLNKDLIKMATYYGFEINVTNCFSGNEKGHVEGSVKYIRNQVFTTKYEFDNFEKAEQHLAKELKIINQESKIESEIKCLNSYKPMLELAEIIKSKVSKYSVIRIENNFYSVPESLNGKEVVTKNYLYDIEIYYNQELVAKHKKINAYLEYVLDINHYLKTFRTKPGALANSQALANNPNLKDIYINYYTKKPKLFIELLTEYKHLSKEALNEILLNNYDSKVKCKAVEEQIIIASDSQISLYENILRNRKERQYGAN